MREEYREIFENQARQESRPLLDPSPAERINRLLDISEVTNSAAWWQLWQDLSLEPDSTQYGNPFENDVTTLPGWKAAGEVTRKRIVDAAKRYLLEQGSAIQEWFGKSIIGSRAWAGYKALILLLEEDRDFLLSLAVDVWDKWIPAILEHPISTTQEGKETKDQTINKELVRVAYQCSRQSIIKAVILLLDSNYYPLGRVEVCWNDVLANALLDKLRDDALRPSSIEHILWHLLNHDIVEAKAFAESLISVPLSSDENQREKAIISGYALLAYTKEVAWEPVWLAIRRDEEFGQDVIARLASSELRKKKVEEKLNENQLADLYMWLVERYPYRPSDYPTGPSAGPIGSPPLLRDSVLRHLIERGTPEACVAIQRIMQKFPELDGMKWSLQEAQAITRRKTWIPPRPEDIVKLAGNLQKRLVQNGDQLLDAIVDSLKRLEGKLQGETPAVFDLWNEVKWHQIKKLGEAVLKSIKGKLKKDSSNSLGFWEMFSRKELNSKVYIPKDENALSDYVKRHLEEDLKERGIIVNREVEIRQAERTDIHIDAIMQESTSYQYDKVTVIIETKGCWNRELNEAMETQLVNRYLKNHPSPYGLYLIGWFICDRWDDSDDRKRDAHRLTISIEDSEQSFDQQARDLSRQGIQVRALILQYFGQN